MTYRGTSVIAVCLIALLVIAGQALAGVGSISNGTVSVVPVGNAGFDVLAKGKTAASVRLSSSGLITAGRVTASGRSLVFSDLTPKPGCGLTLGADDSVVITLSPGDPYPLVSFDLHIEGFDPEKWQSIAGNQPFHFLAMYMPDAEVWHQCGWLNETPVADPFPLLQDVHVGSPEISAYKYNRNWSYTVPLGGHPAPVIGLWAPKSKHYVGLEFESTRLSDNSERDIATGYCWGDGKAEVRKPNPDQFASLVYPHGGRGFQDLVFPKVGSHLQSRGRLLWSLDLPASKDPNRLFYTYVWERFRDRLPSVPSVVDLSWLPGDGRKSDFAAPGSGGTLIVSFSGNDAEFSTPGTKLTLGWTAYNESIVALSKTRRDRALLAHMDEEAQRFLGYAKHATIDGDECVYWEKPLEGRWSDRWGGAPVTTIHNPESFHAGRLFLDLYRYMGKSEYLPVVDKVLNWAKHIGWTRNELADIPSSPSGIGMLPCVSFCLDYYMTFKDAPDQLHRDAARKALDLASSFAYRYMSVWLSDSNRMDNLSPTFQWEVTSGRDWTAASCSADMMLDVLAMVAVHTGDPMLMRVVNGSLSRFSDVYQETYRDSIADYRAGDFTEAYGLYDGSTSGAGRRVPFGGFFQIVMLQPVGNSVARVLAGEKAAMVFNKTGVHTSIRDYRYSPDGNLSFTVKSLRTGFDLSLTVPYVDISGKSVVLQRHGESSTLIPGRDYVRPQQAVWSLLIKNLNDGDRITVGSPSGDSPVLPSEPPLSVDKAKPISEPGFETVRLPYDSQPDTNWDHLDSWAGVPSGQIWSYGTPFHLAASTGKCMVAKPAKLPKPVRGVQSLMLVYSAGEGSAPSVILSDGSRLGVDTQLEAMAWRAWPPVFTSRLVVAPVEVGGKTVTGIDPRSRSVWAMTVSRPSTSQTGDSTTDAGRALAEGAKEWQASRADEQKMTNLRNAASRVPDGTVAVLPPNAMGPANDFLQRAGLLKRAVALTPEQMVDPAFFNPKRFPVAIHASNAAYVHTVKQPGDGADAIVRYVKEGGTLLLCVPGAGFPLYIATGPGFSRGEPLTDRVGMPIDMPLEESHPEKLVFRAAAGQTVLRDVPVEFPWPPGDTRLRTVGKDRLPEGAKYTPIYTVYGASGKSYGDSAGLVELPNGGGKILFVYGLMTAAPDGGPSIARAAVRFLVDSAAKR